MLNGLPVIASGNGGEVDHLLLMGFVLVHDAVKFRSSQHLRGASLAVFETLAALVPQDEVLFTSGY